MKTLVPGSGPASLGEVTAGGPIHSVASLYPLWWEIAPASPPPSRFVQLTFLRGYGLLRITEPIIWVRP